MKLNAKKYLRRYLEISPISVAVWRSVEAKHLSTVSMKSPILDIGCGFGEFAKAYFDEPVDVGIDNAPLDLYGAAKSKKYKNLVLGDARNMPFPNNSFETVFSISTLEHIPNPDKVLKEAYRVLKKNGKLVVTIETTEVEESSIYRPLFKKIGLPMLADLYATTFNTIFDRHTLISKEDWRKKITKAGFVIDRSEDIISPTITRLFDVFLITSWPSQILKPLIGTRFVWRPSFINDLLTNIFIKYVNQKDKNGTNLFIVARKPSA